MYGLPVGLLKQMGFLPHQVSVADTDALLDVSLAPGPPAAALILDARTIELQARSLQLPPDQDTWLRDPGRAACSRLLPCVWCCAQA